MNTGINNASQPCSQIEKNKQEEASVEIGSWIPSHSPFHERSSSCFIRNRIHSRCDMSNIWLHFNFARLPCDTIILKVLIVHWACYRKQVGCMGTSEAKSSTTIRDLDFLRLSWVGIVIPYLFIFFFLTNYERENNSLNWLPSEQAQPLHRHIILMRVMCHCWGFYSIWFFQLKKEGELRKIQPS